MNIVRRVFFSFDLFLQMLTIHLEEADCFAAWLSAKEVGMGQSSDGTDLKRKFVLLFLSRV